MIKNKVVFTEEKETLLIPLYGKAQESNKPAPILSDPKAEEIIEKIDYDFKKLKIAKKTDVMMSMRAKQFDIYTKKFLQQYPDSIVAHIGCGLDCRYERIGENNADWYELDFPEVIEVKKYFFKESQRFHFIASSVTDLGWMQQLPDSDNPVLVLAEGLFMYLHEEDIKALFTTLQSKYKSLQIIFDAFGKLTAKYSKNHPSLKKTGAVINWGIDDEKEIEQWSDGIHFVEEWGFSDSKDIPKLNPGYRFMFNVMGNFKTARIAHRILVFSLTGN